VVFLNNSSCFYATKLPAGNYSLVVQDKNGCEKSFEFEVKDLSVGISPIVNAQFKVYPNPTQSAIHVEFGNANISTLILSDMAGRNLIQVEIDREEEFKELDVQKLPNGTYFLKLNGEEESAVIPIVKF